ncbi:hypothetical protein OAL35_02050 [bacterium]|nr:hypothetical protein [bacterium]
MSKHNDIALALLKCFKSVLASLLLVAVARGQETRQPLIIDFNDQELVFVRLPEQSDINIGGNAAGAGTVPVVATYMLNTELTAASLKALIGDEAYQDYLDGVMLGDTQELEDHVSQREKLNSGSSSIAACSVPMNLVFTSSKKLQEKIENSGLVSPVETVVVRLPTSTEWKYAVTANELVSNMAEYPNFPSWPTAAEIDRMVSSDATLKGYLSDLEEDDEDYGIDKLANEKDFIRALNRSSGDKTKLSGGKSVGQVLTYLLGIFLKHDTQLGLSGNPSEMEETKRDFDPGSGVANSFGLLNIFNNLSEWVMADTADANSSWNDAIELPTDSTLQFYAIGPSTFAQANYKDAWRWMSLNHSYPENDSGEQESLSYVEASDPNNLFYFEGCRFLVVRQMKDDWFSTMRRSFLETKQEPTVFEQFAAVVEKSIREVSVKGRKMDRAMGYVDAYRILVNADTDAAIPLNSDFFRMAEVSSLPVRNEMNSQDDEKPKFSLSIDLGGFSGSGSSTLPKSLQKQKEKEKDSDDASREKNDSGLDFFSVYRDLLEAEALQ